MNPTSLLHAAATRLKPILLATALALAPAAAQALTTTRVIDLGVYPAYTQFAPGTLYPRIALDDLPAGSILRKVSWDVRLGNGDPYLGDLAVYFANRTGAGVLQVGAYGAFVDGGTLVAADAPIKLPWNAGGDYNIGAAASTTLTAANGVPAIDLHDHSVSLETVYAGGWAGTITLEFDIPQLARIMSFGPGAVIGEPTGNSAAITWTVPYGTNVTALAPSFSLSSGTCDKVSGGPATYDFSSPVVYTVTDGATVNTYTVTITVAPDETTLVWDANDGVWDFSTSNWKGQSSGVSTVFFNGKNVVFDRPTGGTVTLAPGVEPLTTTVDSSGNYVLIGAALGGPGTLTKSGAGRLTITGSQNNTYSGGTVINAGRLYLNDVQTSTGLGTGPVTLNGGIFHLDRFTLTTGLTVNGGSIIMDNGFGSSIASPITCNVQLNIESRYTANQILGGPVSGPGGITLTSQNGGGLDLAGTNTYTGDTIVNGGVLKVRGSSIKDSNKLVINSGKVQPIGSETVAALFFGATQQATGTWGALGSGAEHIDDGHFSGTAGVVNVSAATTLTYPQWTSANYPGADLSDPDADADGDGLSNRQEFAFGLNPTAGSSVNPISQPLSRSTGIFKFTRTANTSLTFVHQSSTTLGGTWDVFTPVAAVSNNATPVEEITVTVPASLLTGPRLFVRVSAQ